MNSIFSMESRLMQGLSKVADIMILNLLFLICSIPVITIGASLTALYSVTLKLARNEESYISSSFFKAWKKNFKISTVVWLVMVYLGGTIVVDFRLFLGMPQNTSLVLSVILGVVTIFYMMVLLLVFPYIARFENTIKDTIKNVFLIGMGNFFRMLLALVITLIPVFLTLILKSKYMSMFWILFSFSAVAYLSSFIYRKIFDKYENQNQKSEMS